MTVVVFLNFTQNVGDVGMICAGGVIVGDSGLCCCVPVVRVTSIVRALLVPFVS